MARKRMLTLLSLLLAGVYLAGPAPAQASGQAGMKKMTITGQVAKAAHGYIIRGKTPAEVFTILNGKADVLDALAESEKEVVVDVTVKSGDNVNIEAIDGKAYPSGDENPEVAMEDPSLRVMTLQGEIVKVRHGYVVRGTNKAVILTVLNPEPSVLDKLAGNGQVVEVTVRIVSGDNVNIEAIEGKDYSSLAMEGSADTSVRMVTLQGEIVKVRHGYVVRGTDKAVIFTVLNPEPSVLDKLAGSGQVVEVTVRIVSGDNVNIEAIAGKAYPQVMKP